MKRLLSTAAICAGIVVGVLGFVPQATADLLFTLDDSNCCGSGPFGTVLLDDLSQDVVKVTVTLEQPPSVGIVNTGLTSFLFNNSVAITSGDVSDLTNGFLWTTSLNGDGAGTFQYGFDCGDPACTNGGSGPFPGPFSFTLTAPGLSSLTFTSNANGNYFGVDICYNTAQDATSCSATGLAWTSTLPPPCTDCQPPPCTENCGDTNVPEPTPLALIAAGAIALAVNRRRLRLQR